MRKRAKLRINLLGHHLKLKKQREIEQWSQDARRAADSLFNLVYSGIRILILIFFLILILTSLR